jgi:DNA-binding FrmR family transcriptional regulator
LADQAQSTGSDELLARLRSAQGHLKAVVNMLTRGAPSEELLPQLWSVQAALSAAGERMILAQLRASSKVILNGPSSNQREAEAERLNRILSLATQHTMKSGR